MSLLIAWQNAQTSIRNKIGEASYQSWFSHLSARADTDAIIIETPDEFYKNWLTDNYLDLIRTSLQEQGSGASRIDLVVSTQPLPVNPPRKDLASGPTDSAPDLIYKKPRQKNLQTRFTFENFVMGSSNQFAFKASQAVADNPAKAYNPLFIYGQSGMGKTHLMQSIANHILNRTPQVKCVYITSEQFTNELIEGIRNRSANEFKQKYRSVDVLLIDDIQFIAGKESTQEEFFHTFNELHNAHKQIVITSDRPAKEISKLEDRLVTRFTWGLTVDIQPPDFETRVAILRKKVEIEEVKVRIPEDVIYFIAEQIKTNIRELEGALIRVVACSLLDERPVTLTMAQSILKDMVKETVKAISLEMVMQTVAEYYNVSIADIKSTRRSQNIVVPRQIGMYLSRKLTKHSLPEIGNAFGGRDHTTVLHSFNKISDNLNTNSEIRFAIDKLTTILKR